MILSNQSETYNKVGLGYESKNNAKYFNKIYHFKRKTNYNVFKCNYCGRNDHNTMYCFNKIYDLKWTPKSSSKFSTQKIV